MVVDEKDPLLGTILDKRFELRERLGAGAMGVVYRATQLSIGRDVAVKVITGMDVTTVKRFFREAQIASALSHPNTVQIIEFGQSPDGRVYLAMELVRGHTLQREVEAGAMAPRRIVRIATMLCDALEAAHRQTIVHRDLKPENVMIAEDGTDHVKILDFGIARVLGDASTQLTGAGLSAGTPNYMAPEVLGEAAAPAPAQDMYAVGVIIAELALGRALWNRPSLDLLYADKMVNRGVDEVPPRFRPLVAKLVALEPGARPSPAETREALRQLDRANTDPVGVAPTIDQVAPVAPKPAPAPPVAERPHLESDAFKPPALGGAADIPLELESSWKDERARKGAPPIGRALPERAPAPRPSRSGGAGTLVIALVAAAAVAGGGYYVVTRMQEKPAASTPHAQLPQPEPAPPAPAPAPQPPAPQPPAPKPATLPTPDETPLVARHGVSIRIIGARGTAVSIDGQPAGKTPIALERTAGKRAITIAAPGFVRRVVPDHDQTIDITQP
jgi:serine/threonine protein kinase